jgi:hypothetical protein
MRLTVPKEDGLKVDIIDEHNNDAVGDVRFEKGGGRHVELYGRYKGTFKTHAECAAFVKGVEDCVGIYDRLARSRLRRLPRHLHRQELHYLTPNRSNFSISQGLLYPCGTG